MKIKNFCMIRGFIILKYKELDLEKILLLLYIINNIQNI